MNFDSKVGRISRDAVEINMAKHLGVTPDTSGGGSAERYAEKYNRLIEMSMETNKKMSLKEYI